MSQWPECQQYSVAGVLLVIDGWEAISMYVAAGVLMAGVPSANSIEQSVK